MYVSDNDDDNDSQRSAAGEDNEDMPSDLRQPPVNRRIDTHSQTPLLFNGNAGHQPRHSYDSPRLRPSPPPKRSTFHERDADAAAVRAATKKRYTYAAVFLVVSLISFAVQTETAVYIQHNLEWKKPYCML